MAENVLRIPSLSKSPSLGRVPSLSRTLSGSRGKHVQKTINNFKITVMCGLLTFVVLRSTIGGGKFGTPEQDYVKLRERLSGLRRAHRRALEEAVKKDSSRALTVATEIMYRFDSRISGLNSKPSILLVAAPQPAQCTHEAENRNFIRSMKSKIDYCHLHRIEIFNNRAVDLGVGGDFLTKIELLRAAMLAHLELEWIWWMDSGVVITDMAFEMPMAQYQGYNAVIEGRNAASEELRLSSFFIRNGRWALDLLARWEARWRSGTAAEEVVLAELLATEDKVFFEFTYELHGDWRTVEMRKLSPVLGGDRRTFLTNFSACSPCAAADIGGDADNRRCLRQIERALDTADLHILANHGLRSLQ